MSRALENLENLHFNGLLLTIVYNVWAKKVQRSYVWFQWRLVQNLKENWLVLSKMTWRILQNFVHQLKNIFHFRKKKCIVSSRFTPPPPLLPFAWGKKSFRPLTFLTPGSPGSWFPLHSSEIFLALLLSKLKNKFWTFWKSTFC